MSLKPPILKPPSVYCAKAELLARSAAITIMLRAVFIISLHAGPAALCFLSGVMAGLVPAIHVLLAETRQEIAGARRYAGCDRLPASAVRRRTAWCPDCAAAL